MQKISIGHDQNTGQIKAVWLNDQPFYLNQQVPMVFTHLETVTVEEAKAIFEAIARQIVYSHQI